jgi:transcriptional regulator with XRE-family HTH domain
LSRSPASEKGSNSKRSEIIFGNIAQRLQSLMGDMDARTFAEKIGVSRSFIYDILNGRPSSIALLSDISDNIGYNWRWLVTGEGMPSEHWEQRTTLVPRLASSPTGRAKELKKTDQHMLFATQLLLELGVSLTEAAVFTVPDDDMAPLLNLSDDALIHLSDQLLSQGKLFLIGIDGQITIRRAFSSDGGISWQLTAERQSAQHISISEKTRYKIYGRVRWIGHRL